MNTLPTYDTLSPEQRDAVAADLAAQRARQATAPPRPSVAELLAQYDQLAKNRAETLEPLAEAAEENPNRYAEYDSLRFDYAEDAADLLDVLVAALREQQA